MTNFDRDAYRLHKDKTSIFGNKYFGPSSGNIIKTVQIAFKIFCLK